MNKSRFLIAAACLSVFGATAYAEPGEQIFAPNYEVFVPQNMVFSQNQSEHDGIVTSLKEDIAYIVHNAAALKNFPISPERVLPRVQFQAPITKMVYQDVEIYSFTVDVPVPDYLRNILLETFFSTDVGVQSEKGYFLRLHKEEGVNDSDVGIIIVRGTTPEALKTEEVESVIKSFSTY